MLKKGKSAIEGDPKKVAMEFKQKEELNTRRWGWRLA